MHPRVARRGDGAGTEEGLRLWLLDEDTDFLTGMDVGTASEAARSVTALRTQFERGTT